MVTKGFPQWRVYDTDSSILYHNHCNNWLWQKNTQLTTILLDLRSAIDWANAYMMPTSVGQAAEASINTVVGSEEKYSHTYPTLFQDIWKILMDHPFSVDIQLSDVSMIQLSSLAHPAENDTLSLSFLFCFSMTTTTHYHNNLNGTRGRKCTKVIKHFDSWMCSQQLI